MITVTIKITVVSLDKSEKNTFVTQYVANTVEEAIGYAKEAYPYAKRIKVLKAK